jgi:murein DD-endopeptidase MepM/ murein hydrolase activator NlpD
LDAELVRGLEVALGRQNAARAAEFYDGYLLLEQLDQQDDHFSDVADTDPPADREPVAGFALPAGGPITSRYGMRESSIDGQRRLDAGIDLGVGMATPIRVSKAGTVTRAEDDPVYGLVVMTGIPRCTPTIPGLRYGRASRSARVSC